MSEEISPSPRAGSVLATSLFRRRSIFSACSALLLLLPGAASAVPFVATEGQFLSRFTSEAPNSVTAVAITGMQSGEKLVALDYRPANGQLYGVGSTSRLYRLNPETGAATAVGPAGSFTLNGSNFAIDFNPVSDVIRLISDTEQNIRIDPNSGTLIATDNKLNPAGNMVAVAHTNNIAGTTQTTVFAIDSASGHLVRIGSVNGDPDSPNTGIVTDLGPIG